MQSLSQHLQTPLTRATSNLAEINNAVDFNAKATAKDVLGRTLIHKDKHEMPLRPSIPSGLYLKHPRFKEDEPNHHNIKLEPCSCHKK